MDNSAAQTYSDACDIIASGWLVPSRVNGEQFFPLLHPQRLRLAGTVVGFNASSDTFTKLHLIGDDDDPLEHEYKIYQQLTGEPWVPKLQGFGTEGRWRYLSMESVGIDITSIWLSANGWTISIACAIVKEMLNILHGLHLHGYIHGDIKPPNFCCRLDNAINLGVEFSIVDMESVTTCPVDAPRRPGTAYWSSSYALAGAPQSWRDDLHSLAYILLNLCGVELPWDEASWEDDIDEMIRLKRRYSAPALCEDLPPACVEFVQLCLGLDFMEVPPMTL
ncbi:Casein kinase I [Grifola frondosa]|uniref:non-specific serine/threonine protein kinase n=1 Tax=Grifola frondosa TaxID=5627 RepID=A0A1C7M7M9_GRIFR|nr:Casein kinase I [Grifola frondosa]